MKLDEKQKTVSFSSANYLIVLEHLKLLYLYLAIRQLGCKTQIPIKHTRVLLNTLFENSVDIQISWLLMKRADLDPHFFIHMMNPVINEKQLKYG